MNTAIQIWIDTKLLERLDKTTDNRSKYIRQLIQKELDKHSKEETK